MDAPNGYTGYRNLDRCLTEFSRLRGNWLIFNYLSPYCQISGNPLILFDCGYRNPVAPTHCVGACPCKDRSFMSLADSFETLYRRSSLGDAEEHGKTPFDFE